MPTSDKSVWGDLRVHDSWWNVTTMKPKPLQNTRLETSRTSFWWLFRSHTWTPSSLYRILLQILYLFSHSDPMTPLAATAVSHSAQTSCSGWPSRQSTALLSLIFLLLFPVMFLPITSSSNATLHCQKVACFLRPFALVTPPPMLGT